MIANIHSFESLATLDGEGIRYGIFFMGCPLRCVYCHNPDTWCGEGQKYSPKQLFEKIKRYKPYFKDNGGVTFSGGEPLLHAEFINEIQPLLSAESICYTLDTSGCVQLNEEVKQSLLNAKLVILDLKFSNEADYKKYTNGSLALVLGVLDFLEDNNKLVWIRTVIIPKINDNIAYLSKCVDLIKPYKCVKKYELLPFHTMGFYKYEKLGIRNQLKDTSPLDNETLIELQKYIEQSLK